MPARDQLFRYLSTIRIDPDNAGNLGLVFSDVVLDRDEMQFRRRDKPSQPIVCVRRTVVQDHDCLTVFGFKTLDYFPRSWIWLLAEICVHHQVFVEGIVPYGFLEQGLDDTSFANPGQTDNAHRLPRGSHKVPYPGDSLNKVQFDLFSAWKKNPDTGRADQIVIVT